MSYAEETKVPVVQSKTDIETILMKYGAVQFASFSSQEQAGIMFTMNERQIKFLLKLPKLNEFRSEKQFNQKTRSLWRGLLLCIKSKLVSVESDITTFEEEFMAHTVLPDGLTVAEFMAPQIEAAYETGQVPAMLPGFGGDQPKRIEG